MSVEQPPENPCMTTLQRCRWSCGNQCALLPSNLDPGTTFREVASRFYSRRSFLRLLTVGAALAAPLPLRFDGGLPARPAGAEAATTQLRFPAIEPSTRDEIVVPQGYRAKPVISWGDPLFLWSPSWDWDRQDPAAQALQFGYNCDYLAVLPLVPGYALLHANHEYTNPELMFRAYSADSPTREQALIEIEAHGFSTVVLRNYPSEGWHYVRSAPYVPYGWLNRRVTGSTPITISGPAAGHPWMQTREDPSGRLVKGTLNNCGGGITLWNTILTAEENFHQYFANADGVTDSAKRAAHARYGLPRGASERKWERFDQRFDLSAEPNEPFRFGWIVEYDPYRPDVPPVKRTALGRFKHEAATCVLTTDGRVAVYMGDDERFEYMYKFVTSGRYNPSNRDANRNLLDSGTLFVARFYEDGTGEWIPLVYGVGPLTERNGFRSQADVCIKTRQAADLVGATAMDRPEDIETNPVNNRVYCVMTNNTRRGTGSNPGTNAANPRANNRHGHIIELMPENGDHGSTRFRWNIFLLCGPKDDPTAYFAGFPKEWVSGISCPDNITFDDRGILWIATDGQPSSLGVNDGIFAVPTGGIERGACRQFLAGVRGCEVASPHVSPDYRALFASIQHPGEDSTLTSPSSTFPYGDGPRPSVVVSWSETGGKIGA